MQEHGRAHAHPGVAPATRIKSKDIKDAIAKINTVRPSLISTTTSIENAYGSQRKNTLLDLPGEVRNRIYQYTLDLNETRTRVPRRIDDLQPRANGFQLLGTCRQVTLEARSMFESKVTAYIPVTGAIDFGFLIDCVNKVGPTGLLPVQNTIIVGILSSMNVHMHLHTDWQRFKALNGQYHYRPSNAAKLIFGRLRQALLILVSSSAALAQSRGGLKRKALLHLDHLYSHWLEMIRLVGPWTLGDIVRIMGHDKHTEWELRVYVYTNSSSDGYLEEDDASDSSYFRELVELCQNFDNIKVVAEVYGDYEWSFEGQTSQGEQVEVTRQITPSSVLWPSWPQDVAWRQPAPGHENLDSE